jgi:hypothetical protein
MEERIWRERGSERWILGEDLAWFVHLEEGQREYLERRKEKTSSMQMRERSMFCPRVRNSWAGQSTLR